MRMLLLILAFEYGSNCKDLTAQEVKNYIRFIGNRRLSAIRFRDQYIRVDKNPLTWLDTMLECCRTYEFL